MCVFLQYFYVINNRIATKKKKLIIILYGNSSYILKNRIVDNEFGLSGAYCYDVILIRYNKIKSKDK